MLKVTVPPENIYENMSGDFPGGPVVKTPNFHWRGAWVRSLIGELRSCMLSGMAKIK